MDLHFSLLTEYDIYLFRSGKHFKLYEKFGAHIVTDNGERGVYFSVWAPHAKDVFLMGDFNGWDKTQHRMYPRIDSSGIWEICLPNIGQGSLYKYSIHTKKGYILEKTDPFGFLWEVPPQTASIVWDMNYKWQDKNWLAQRKKKADKLQPMSVYEVHFGSWRRKLEEGNRSLTYKEAEEQLVPYVKEMGFTHIEFMPIMEHPYEPSWGYQVLGFFAPSSRFGTPQDFMSLVDAFHENNIGVILDWVPSHFPMDAHGLYNFDGTNIYEYPDPRKGYHPDWKSAIFDYGRPEVRSFLGSSAFFWLDKYHADGLRVDAVASMLYLDYSRKDGEWLRNRLGGNEHLEAVDFIRILNEAIGVEFPDTITIAEESTAWYGVSKPVWEGGLGFGQKWMMGWMHDTLSYFKRPTLYRPYHQNEITFSLQYAFSENFMLPLSHDEVVYGKGSLLTRMPGDEREKFYNLRAMLSFMYTHPGTRLLFMGCEFGQGGEWNFKEQLDWWLLLDSPNHLGVQTMIKDLNALTAKHGAFYEKTFSQEGFEWIAGDDTENSILLYVRKGNPKTPMLLVACNFSWKPQSGYGLGVPVAGTWREIYNSDDVRYNGSGAMKNGSVVSTKGDMHGKKDVIHIEIPALSVVIFEHGKKLNKV